MVNVGNDAKLDVLQLGVTAGKITEIAAELKITNGIPASLFYKEMVNIAPVIETFFYDAFIQTSTYVQPYPGIF